MKPKILPALVLVLLVDFCQPAAAATKPLWDWFLQSSGDARALGISNLNFITFTNLNGNRFVVSNSSTGLELWSGNTLIERINSNGTCSVLAPMTNSSLVVTGTAWLASLVLNGQAVASLPPAAATIVTNNGGGYNLAGTFTGSLIGNAATATSAGMAATAGTATNLADAASISSATVTGAVNFASFARLSLSKKSVNSVANGNNTVNLGTNIVTEISGPTAAFTNNSFVSEGNTEGDLRILLYQGAQPWAIANESGFDGTAANRITTLTGANVSGNGPFAAWFRYTSSRWRLFGLYPAQNSGGSSGGGDSTGWSTNAAVLDVNLAGHALTNVSTLALTNSSAGPGQPLVSLTVPTNNTSAISYLAQAAPYVSNDDGSFNLVHEGAWFNGVWDDVMTWGYNQGGGGQRQKTNATGYWLQLEQNFRQFASPPQAQSEYHLDFIDMNGNSDRPFMYSCDYSNLNNWLEHYVCDSVDFRFPMQGYSNTWLTLSPTATIWDFDNTNGVQLTYSSGYTQFRPYSSVVPAAAPSLLFQGWSQISFQGYSGAPNFYFTSNQFSCPGAINQSGGNATFAGQSFFQNDVHVQNAFFNIDGKHSTFGQNPMIHLQDNSTATGLATNGRDWDIGLSYYTGGGYGHLTATVGNQKGDFPYQNGHGTDVLDLSSNNVVLYGNTWVTNGSLAIATTPSAPSPGSNGWLWNSNNTLYWVTAGLTYKLTP